MADTTPSKVYDIAEKLGYEGATWAYLVIPDPSTLADDEMFAFSIVKSNN